MLILKEASKIYLDGYLPRYKGFKVKNIFFHLNTKYIFLNNDFWKNLIIPLDSA